MLISATAVVLFVIVMGNVFTIFLFWTQTPFLKRSFFFSRSILLGSHNYHNFHWWKRKIKGPWWAFQIFGSSTSLMFLAHISLERVQADFWPLRHRGQVLELTLTASALSGWLDCV